MTFYSDHKKKMDQFRFSLDFIDRFIHVARVSDFNQTFLYVRPTVIVRYSTIICDAHRKCAWWSPLANLVFRFWQLCVRCSVRPSIYRPSSQATINRYFKNQGKLLYNAFLTVITLCFTRTSGVFSINLVYVICCHLLYAVSVSCYMT